MLNLSKGESIAIANSSGSVVNRVRMGLGWKPLLEAKVPGILGKLLGKTQSAVAPIDLDASCILFDKDKKVVDKIYFANLTSRVGKIKHSGDDRTGMGGDKGVDNESIQVDLSSLPAEVEAIVFVVNSFTGQTFETVGDAYVGLIDDVLSIEDMHKNRIVPLVAGGDSNSWQFGITTQTPQSLLKELAESTLLRRKMSPTS
jgi:tellurium resistance protein TerZ